MMNCMHVLVTQMRAFFFVICLCLLGMV
jgi:hypothetical protein